MRASGLKELMETSSSDNQPTGTSVPQPQGRDSPDTLNVSSKMQLLSEPWQTWREQGREKRNGPNALTLLAVPCQDLPLATKPNIPRAGLLGEALLDLTGHREERQTVRGGNTQAWPSPHLECLPLPFYLESFIFINSLLNLPRQKGINAGKVFY